MQKSLYVPLTKLPLLTDSSLLSFVIKIAMIGSNWPMGFILIMPITDHVSHEKRKCVTFRSGWKTTSSKELCPHLFISQSHSHHITFAIFWYVSPPPRTPTHAHPDESQPTTPAPSVFQKLRTYFDKNRKAKEQLPYTVSFIYGQIFSTCTGSYYSALFSFHILK